MTKSKHPYASGPGDPLRTALEAMAPIAAATPVSRRAAAAVTTSGLGTASREAAEAQRRFVDMINGVDTSRAGSAAYEAARQISQRIGDAAGGGSLARADAVMKNYLGGGIAPAQPRLAAPAPAPITSPAELGACIRAARKGMKMSQQRFADLTGVGRRFLSELEAGKPTVELGKALACCAAAGIDLVARKRG